jgi:hypothetical protein
MSPSRFLILSRLNSALHTSSSRVCATRGIDKIQKQFEFILPSCALALFPNSVRFNPIFLLPDFTPHPTYQSASQPAMFPQWEATSERNHTSFKVIYRELENVQEKEK